MDEETTVQISRILAAVAAGELAEEAGQQAIDEIRRQAGLEDSVALDAAQRVGSHALGIGSGAADITDCVTNPIGWCLVKEAISD